MVSADCSYDRIPAALTERKQWVVWKTVQRGGKPVDFTGWIPDFDVVPGDWIILEDPPGDGTRAYPCKPDVFENKYEETTRV